MPAVLNIVFLAIVNPSRRAGAAAPAAPAAASESSRQFEYGGGRSPAAGEAGLNDDPAKTA
jgi:hypothetical protein